MADLLHAIGQFGITVAVGASTFAVIFYYVAIQDGVIDSSEKRFMHIVYTVLRIGMVVIIITQLLSAFLLYSRGDSSLFLNEFLLFNWTLLGIIIVNAVLMQRHYMPMWLGPALAGGSWYTLAFINAFAPSSFASYSTLAVYYGLFVALMVILLRIITKIYVKNN